MTATDGTDGTDTAPAVAPDVATETGHVETDGIRTYYERRGDGPPVVFVHGMALSTTMWARQAAALSDEFTTVTYDVRGHGRTSGSAVETYSTDLFADDLDAFLTALDIDRPVLCGLSMGGAIVQAYAAKHPDWAADLVLADTFPTAGRLAFANVRFLGWLQQYVDYNRLNRLQMWAGNRLVSGWAGDGVTVQELIDSDPRIPADELRKIARATAAFPAGDLDRSGVTAPVFILHAEHAPLGASEMAAAVADGFPNAPVERLVAPDALLSWTGVPRPMRALTLGPEGTYSHRATRAVADDIEFVESVTGIVDGVADGEYERGVVPIENSIEGSVTESLDALADRDVAVVQEIITPIRHALMAQSGAFDVVASHAQALAQCRSYLEAEYPDATMEAVASTARGVERARDDPDVAAIGHPDTAGDDLQVLAEDIQDRTSNATRFLVLAPEAERSDAGGKTSAVIYPNTNYPGLLLEMLQPFADRDVNLSRVESRPSGERLGDYVFHLDFAAGMYEERAREAVGELEELAHEGWVRVLGSYDSKTVLY